MNKTIKSIAFALLAAPTVTVLADEGPGCGWGTQVFKGQSGLSAHTAAATTNGILGNQTFGMTFGTAGCDTTKVVMNDFERRTFVAGNLDNLSQEMAQGSGEHLAVLAGLMGIGKEDQASFYRLTQNQYGKLFQSTATSGSDLLASLDVALAADGQLAKYVR